MNRTNLRVVFDECTERGILTSLNESCCDTCNSTDMIITLEKKPEFFGFVFSHAQTVDHVMEELLEDGSATILFGFGGKTEKDDKKTGYALASILKKHGYIVDWNERLDRKIAVVIEESDLPPGFKDKWIQTHEEYMAKFGGEDDEESTPIARIKRASMKTYFKELIECQGCEEANTVCDNSCGTVICDKCNKESYIEDGKRKYGHHPNCGEESNADDELKDEDEEEEKSDDSSIPDASDIEEDSEIPECPPDCDCFNCVAEREEAKLNE